ncbi:MAG: hypothetical protein CME37_11500 [Haliea sp.]|nr:hypothetical protein [Haliea sp.]
MLPRLELEETLIIEQVLLFYLHLSKNMILILLLHNMALQEVIWRLKKYFMNPPQQLKGFMIHLLELGMVL